MESDTRQSPLVSSNTVRYYLSLACIGWYTVHWFIQLVGVYAASVTSPITITGRTARLPTFFCPLQSTEIPFTIPQISQQLSSPRIRPRGLDFTPAERTRHKFV